MTEEQFLKAQQLREEIKTIESHQAVAQKQASDMGTPQVGLGEQVWGFSKFIDWSHYHLMMARTLAQRKAELAEL